MADEDVTGEGVACRWSKDHHTADGKSGTEMKILDDLLSTLNTEVTVRDMRQGLFHTAVLTRNCGLAATLPRDALRQQQPSVKDPGFLLKKSALR